MPPKPETHSRSFYEIQPVLGPSVDQICLTQHLPATRMSWAWIFQDLQLQKTLQCHLSPLLWLSHNLKFSWIQRAACRQLILKTETWREKKKEREKKSLSGIGRKDKYFWLISASILLPWFGAEVRGSSFAHSHTVCPAKQKIQLTLQTAVGWEGMLSSGRSSSLCCHWGKDYPRDQQWNPGLVMLR